MITSYKIQPRYLHELLNRKHVDPVFITRDIDCLKYIHRLKGTCLFCDLCVPARRFNFNDCFKREVWVLFSDDSYQSPSIELGRAIKQAGAEKVLIIPFPITKPVQKETP